RIGASGRVVNRGLMKIYGAGSTADLDVPVQVESSGQLWVTEGVVCLLHLADLRNAGVIQLDSGTQLRLANVGRRLVMLPGGQLVGTGTLVVESGTRLELAEDLEVALTLSNSGTVSSQATLRLRGNQV